MSYLYFGKLRHSQTGNDNDDDNDNDDIIICAPKSLPFISNLSLALASILCKLILWNVRFNYFIFFMYISCLL